jgi:RNA polymerase sigma factor (sigma-70 family)
MEPGEHLFRREAGRMVAALTRIFGLHNLALAEDVVQDAFCRALEVWRIRGVPDNPSAWLMRTAKNRAIDVLRRERTARDFAPELNRLFESEWTLVPTVTELFGPSAIKDDQLRMMFTCCHPQLSEQAQVALVLNLVCGFTADEIASAFLSRRAGIEKRISRSKKVLAASHSLFDFADREFSTRLGAVQRALYLLFNEGYHGSSAASTVRVELCREAMRLGMLLLDHPAAATPATYALCALMHLDAARLPARVDGEGGLTALFDQDRSRWNSALVAQGEKLLEQSATGSELSEYHVEAAIAAVHARARNAQDTDWEAIVKLYDTLMRINPSPVVALNRAIAIAQHEGPARGLEEIRTIVNRDRLAAYPFYFAALGELELRGGNHEVARSHFQAALGLARNPMERRFLERRVGACDVRPIADLQRS